MKFLFLVSLALSSLFANATGMPAITQTEDLQNALSQGFPDNCPFVTMGTVALYLRPLSTNATLTILSNGTRVKLREKTIGPRPRLSIGDTVRVSGRTKKRKDTLYAEYESVTVLGSDHTPVRLSIDEYFSNTNMDRLVEISGIVQDIFPDESDSNWHYLTLYYAGFSVYAMVFANEGVALDASEFIGRKVEVVGMIVSADNSIRKRTGRLLLVSGDENIKQQEGSSGDPFAAPPLSAIDETCPPEKLTSFGLRTTSGTVLGIWEGKNVLIRTESGTLVTLNVGTTDLPSYGDVIEAVGLPGTTFYHWQLAHARWRKTSFSPPELLPAMDIHVRDLLYNRYHQPELDIIAHGKAIRIRGIVRHMPSGPIKGSCFYLESDGCLVPIDATGVPTVLDRLSIGCEISASGTCIIESDVWTPTTVAPKAKGIRIVLRTPDDIVVLKRPSWWTPRLIWTVIGTLGLLLFSITAWNVTLRKVATRRGRELAREQISRAEAELRIRERTRLAIELHDSLSQNLMAVAMRLDAVKRAAAPCGEVLEKRISMLARAIRFCREELRNCLYDLRNETLEETDMGEAIRQSLSVYVDDNISLVIRFNVPRYRLTDQTAHAVLQIVRELVINACHHGRARTIRIAGSLDKTALLFSVRDDGCGFDVASIPGVTEGHFGLQGIQERLDSLRGKMTIDSVVGKGSKITIKVENTYKVSST